MFWLFLVLVFLAVTFVKLGAMTVWVTVFTGSLQLTFLFIGAAGIVMLWRRLRNR